jgi:hypothetical protein
MESDGLIVGSTLEGRTSTRNERRDRRGKKSRGDQV